MAQHKAEVHLAARMLRQLRATGVLTAITCAGVAGQRLLQQISELRHRQTRPDCQAAHGVPVDRVVAGDDQIHRTVGHRDALAFALNPESCSNERTVSALVVDSGTIGRLSSHREVYFHFIQFDEVAL